MVAYSFWLIVPAGTADDEDQGRPAGRWRAARPAAPRSGRRMV